MSTHFCISNPCYICFPQFKPINTLEEMMIKKEGPLTPDFVLESKKKAEEALVLEEIIIDRIDYVITKVFEVFNGGVTSHRDFYWYFDGADEGQVGDLWSNFYEDEISFVMECPINKMFILLKDGSEYRFNSCIPTRWLFEDFEQELVDGKKAYEEKRLSAAKRKKELSLKKNLKDKELVSDLKRRLSKEELAALKRSL